MTLTDLSALIQGLAPAIRDYVLTSQKPFEKRLTAVETQDLIPGPVGAKGDNGKDALGFDDIQVDFDGERKFSLKFVRGEEQKQFGVFRLPLMIYRGVFDERQTYEKDDVMTWAGAMWIAKTDQPKGKPNASPDYQLVVKKGSDGRQGPEGKGGPTGPQGPQGGKW